jgi:hypothetical protein
MFSSPEKPPPAAEEPPPADDTEKPPPPPPGNADDKPPPPSQEAFDLLKTKCEELDATLLASKKQVAEQQGVAENDAEAMTQMKTALAEAEGKSASVAEESATQMAAVTAECVRFRSFRSFASFVHSHAGAAIMSPARAKLHVAVAADAHING